MRRENESGKHLLGRKGILRKDQNRSSGNLADTDKQLVPGWGQHCSQDQRQETGSDGHQACRGRCGAEAGKLDGESVRCV